jgi:hypothetical protein
MIGLVLGARARQITGSERVLSQVATVFVQLLPTTGFMDSCAGEEILSPVLLASTADGIVGRVKDGSVIKIFWPPGFSAI